MADSVNRIVPAPVTIDRAGQSSRDGRRKKPPGPGKPPSAAGTPPESNPADGAEPQDPSKGKNLDVSA